jgi:hypothetical protein
MTEGRPQRGDAAHARAVEGLDAARDQQSRMRDAADDARGSSSEEAADDKLQEAENNFAAREAWLTWLERGF